MLWLEPLIPSRTPLVEGRNMPRNFLKCEYIQICNLTVSSSATGNASNLPSRCVDLQFQYNSRNPKPVPGLR